MGFLRRVFHQVNKTPDDSTVNPSRTRDLYKLTLDGYIIAQDIACQYDYAINHAQCPACGASVRVAAQLNHASQGLNEIVCLCNICGKRHSLFFDVSNAVYQKWLAELMGDLYIRDYHGEPRHPA